MNENNTYNDYQKPVGNGLAITGMILGVIAIVYSLLSTCCPSILLGIILELIIIIIGFVVSIIAKKKGQSKGMCNTGIICSIIALLMMIGGFVISLLPYFFAY